MSLFGVAHNIAHASRKPYDKSNRESTKGYTAYIRDLPPCIPEEPKRGVKKKPRIENDIGGARKTTPEKANESNTSQNITGSGIVTQQSVEEALSHQVRVSEAKI